LPVRNPVFSQSLNLPLYKEFGEIHPKIQKITTKCKDFDVNISIILQKHSTFD